MSALKPGDRVRVVETVEGVVHVLGESSICVDVDRGDHGGLEWFEFATASVEVLPPPEPDWQPGDVVRVGEAVHVRKQGGGWFSHFLDGCCCSDEDISGFWREGRLTLLVRDGKPVQP